MLVTRLLDSEGARDDGHAVERRDSAEKTVLDGNHLCRDLAGLAPRTDPDFSYRCRIDIEPLAELRSRLTSGQPSQDLRVRPGTESAAADRDPETFRADLPGLITHAIGVESTHRAHRIK